VGIEEGGAVLVGLGVGPEVAAAGAPFPAVLGAVVVWKLPWMMTLRPESCWLKRA
jgi:hypothetical protein